MHFLLLGATGRTGKHVVSELLSQSHTAVALHSLVDEEVRLTEMDWTLVRASRLVFDDPKNPVQTDGKPDVQTLAGDGAGMRMTDSVNVASAARFLVKVAVEDLFIRSAVVIRD